MRRQERRNRVERARGADTTQGTWDKKPHDSRRPAPPRAPLFAPSSHCAPTVPPLRRSRDVGTPCARRPPPRLPFHTTLPPVTPSPLRSSCSFVLDRCVLLGTGSLLPLVQPLRWFFLGVLGFNFQPPSADNLKGGILWLSILFSPAPLFRIFFLHLLQNLENTSTSVGKMREFFALIMLLHVGIEFLFSSRLPFPSL